MNKELIENDEAHPKITGSPETIWLNYGDLERDDTHENCSRNGEVTWCEEAVFVSDVKYVKADRIEELERKVFALKTPCAVALAALEDFNEQARRQGICIPAEIDFAIDKLKEVLK